MRSVLDIAEERGRCQVVLRENVTLDDLLDVFQDTRYRGRIALFHYAGHADDYMLLLERSAGVPLIADAGGLAAFLAGKPELKFVFLNGCATEGHVEGLQGAGVPAVVATTSGTVHDEKACRFAQRFYKGLAGGASIGAAFAEARAQFQIEAGEQLEVPWEIFTRSEQSLRWSLPMPELQHTDTTSDAQRGMANRRALCQKIADFWIGGVYDPSVQDYPQLDLDIETHPELVEQPFADSVHLHQVRQKLKLSALSETFDKLNGSMLIVGEPGSGKTMALLALAKELLQKAEEDSLLPVPVIFNLSSWNDKEFGTFRDWLLQQFHLHYAIGTQLAASWLDNNQLVLLLDGLDEVAADGRSECIAAIDEYQKGRANFLSLVICCRLGEYIALNRKLRLDGAILLQPLSSAQIQAYIQSGGSHMSALGSLLEYDTQMMEMASTPLMLNILSTAFEGVPAEVITGQAPSIYSRRRHLFDLYVNRMVEREVRTRRPAKDTESLLRFLPWLASKMHEHSLTIFAIEDVQPGWLSTRWLLRSYQAGVLITAGFLAIIFCGLGFAMALGLSIVFSGQHVTSLLNELMFCLGFGALWAAGLVLSSVLANIVRRPIALVLTITALVVFVTPFLARPLDGLLLGTIVGLPAGVAGLALVEKQPIVFADKLRWSTRRALVGAAIGVFAGLAIAWAADAQSQGGTSSSDLVLVATLLGVLGMFAPALTIRESIDMRVTPNQGFWRSARNARSVGAAVLLTILVLSIPNGLLDGNLQAGMSLGFFMGLPISFSVALWAGGAACIRHAVLRLALQRDSRQTYRLSHLLDAAVDGIFLRRVGGSYIFIHRLLLEHFVAIYDGTSNEEVSTSHHLANPASLSS